MVIFTTIKPEVRQVLALQNDSKGKRSMFKSEAFLLLGSGCPYVCHCPYVRKS